MIRDRLTELCYAVGMADTLTIRLDERDREVLETAARERSIGLSAFVRDLAEAEARRLRRRAILADGARVVAYLNENSAARAETEMYGTPQTDLP